MVRLSLVALPRLAPYILALFLLALPHLSAALAAPLPALTLAWTRLAAGIEYAAFSSWEGPRRELHALRVDLAAVEAVVTPAGPAFGQVIGRSVIEFAREFDCVAAVNATPFFPDSYRKGEPRWLSGLLLIDGTVHSAPARNFSALAVDTEGRAYILPQVALGDSAAWRWAVGGFFPLVREGSVVARRNSRQPMTAVGILPGRRSLIFLVVDGRRPGSAGLSEEEAARLFLAFGAIEALGLDGGGSSAMVIRGADGNARIVNQPLHFGFPPMERIVGTCLGFRPRS